MKENKKLNSAGNTATPYDDVYRTLLNDCTSLIIPVVNEVFQKQHNENEKYLRQTKNTSDYMDICIKVPEASCTYRVPVLKVQNYTLEKIFEKRLFFLIPFHIFSYEKHFSEYESDEKKLQELQRVYIQIVKRLNHCVECGMISEYIKATVVTMSKKVLDALTVKYSRVQEGVGKIMGGKILDYEAKDILNRGREEGREEGISLGVNKKLRELVEKKVKKGISVPEIADMLEEESEIIEGIVKSLNQV